MEIICPKCGERKKDKLDVKNETILNQKEKNEIEVNELLKDDIDILDDEDDEKTDHIINVE